MVQLHHILWWHHYINMVLFQYKGGRVLNTGLKGEELENNGVDTVCEMWYCMHHRAMLSVCRFCFVLSSSSVCFGWWLKESSRMFDVILKEWWWWEHWSMRGLVLSCHPLHDQSIGLANKVWVHSDGANFATPFGRGLATNCWQRFVQWDRWQMKL